MRGDILNKMFPNGFSKYTNNGQKLVEALK